MTDPDEIVQDDANQRAGGGTEVRVHGIGDHDPWSALGSPTLVTDGFPRAPDVASPPLLPVHSVRLVNWSRKSRKVAGLLWYVALPFTLVNAAGFMRSPGDEPTSDEDPSRPGPAPPGYTAAAACTGVLLTLLSYVWALALIDTFARRAFVGVTSSLGAGPVLALLLGVALCTALFARASRPEVCVPHWLVAAHVAVVVVATALSTLSRPSHWQVPRGVPGLFTTWGPSATFRKVLDGQPVPTFEQRIESGELVPYLDVVLATSIVAIAVVTVAAAVVLTRGFIKTVRSDQATQEFGAAVALPSAVLLFVSVASALRLFLDNGLYYLARHNIWPTQGPDPVSAPFRAREILPPLNTLYAGRDDWLVDLLPLIGLLAIASLALTFLCANLLPSGAGRPRSARLGDSPKERAVWKRDLVLTLPNTSGPALAAGALLWLGATGLVFWWVLTGSAHVWSVCVVLVQAISVITVVLVVAGRGVTAIRKTFGLTADIVGFWPVTSHPFGGASYREHVVEGMHAELVGHGEGPVVLVGHSQGSVLSAWLLHRHLADFDHVHLITCGSPLKSLYREFFPAHFPRSFFDALQTRRAQWHNFWRETDPIATAMPGLTEIDDHKIADPAPDGRLKVHSDYWLAEDQVAAVGLLLSGPQTPRRSGDSVAAE